ncbi:MAG: hypothetical protein CVV49_13420 [Spirochaetae bacterium HGW-Spirochaetae-5]|nr:MAG: hypothetical protein CVV49_13420 [Spirochaetae bacterium HGW-Spirochaetae-5]
MKKKYVMSFFALILLIFPIQSCSTKASKKPESSNSNQNGYNESFRKIGWVGENKYRSVIFIITEDECRNSSDPELSEKIQFESYKNLQKELNPAFNRNASIQIKNLVENSGKLVKTNKECSESNIFFYDIEKRDLKSDFEKIKNLK